MKAIAVFPGKKGSVHLTKLPKPKITDIPDDKGVLVKILRAGVDGTDKEIIDAEYGVSPNGYNFLVLGHENFGIVEEVGEKVSECELKIGNYVVVTVRRPGRSIYDIIGTPDMTTDDIYYERGINLLHGYLTEYIVDDYENIIKVPKGLKEVAILLEPMSIVEKGIQQAYEIQKRLRVWKPRRVAVLGTGTIGLLASLILRLKGFDVYTFARTKPPYLGSQLIEEIGAHYISTIDQSFRETSVEHGPFDIIFEATGFSPLAFEAMELLGKNGVLILASVTGGNRKVEVHADKINLGFVLGNKVMVGTVNANREHFERGVQDFSQALLQYPGWLEKLLTHPIKGLENYEQMLEIMAKGKNVIKIFFEVASLPE
ncbi:MAG: glucose 1-dehydrogenase [Candidatus Hodarchaeales archaeon]|jgi:threonine dehydrogenase-like Zn-dependent dehydrogenase